MGSLLRRLGIVRHPKKGRCDVSRRLDHIGVHVDLEAMRVYMAYQKVALVRGLSIRFLLIAQKNRRLVSLALLYHFCGVCVTLTLWFPISRFYARSIYLYMSLQEKRENERTRSLR